MPKKKDSETKKSRKSSSASKDSVASSGNCEIVPPPNPQATHLIASNPFDDPPPLQTHMKVGGMIPHGFSGQPMSRMQPGAMNVGFPPGWASKAEMRGLRPAYSGMSLPPSFQQGPVHMIRGPAAYHPSIPPNHGAYGMNPRAAHFSSGPGMSFRHSSRMISSNFRPGMPNAPIASEALMEQQSMSIAHVGSGPTGHMTALTRPPSQMPSPTLGSFRRANTNLGKAASSETKSPKGAETSSKSRKKSDKKLQQESRAKNNADSMEKSIMVNNGMEHNLIGNPGMATMPKFCKACSNDINVAVEDAIQCLASCNMWYHRNCVGLTEAAYKFLVTEELALWVCDPCLQTKEINAVRTRVITTPGMQIASNA